MEPADLRVSEIPEPKAGPGALQVEVRAAGCNFFDILITQGKYQIKPAFPFTPGGEIAGVVKAIGAGVEDFAVGDRVLARKARRFRSSTRPVMRR
jgi:NADPH2:quinone reductase